MLTSIKPWFEYPTLINCYIVDLVLNELSSVRPGFPKNNVKSAIVDLGEAAAAALASGAALAV